MLNQILYTACVTPFDSTGAIDYNSFERVLRMQEKAGNGVVIFGSTGEGLSLTYQERQEMAFFVCDLELKTEIVMGVPSYNLNAALEWLDFCNTLPITGYLMTTPMYTKPGIQGQIHWFQTLLDRAAYPAALYNIPGRTGVRLHPECIQRLQLHPKLMMIKDSGGTVDSIVEYKMSTPSVPIYCGDDYMMPAMGIEGATGLVSIISNAWPEATRRYVEACIQGKKFTDTVWWEAGKALFSASNPIPIKALLNDLQYISHDTVRLPLSVKDLPSRKTLFAFNDIITNWMPPQS